MKLHFPRSDFARRKFALSMSLDRGNGNDSLGKKIMRSIIATYMVSLSRDMFSLSEFVL